MTHAARNPASTPAAAPAFDAAGDERAIAAAWNTSTAPPPSHPRAVHGARSATPRPLRFEPLDGAAALDEERGPSWRHPATWAAATLLVIALAWFAGAIVAGRGGFALPTLGPRFTATISSRPVGAFVAIDGHDTGRQTPTTVDLAAGTHDVTLTMPGGAAGTYKVSGQRQQVATLDATLYATVHVATSDPRIPVAVSLDGTDRGYAPLSIEDVAPGPHELRFIAPGSTPWTETFEVGVGQTHDAVARPFTIPPTGTLTVTASLAGDGATRSLKGAEVYIDGELRATTPADVEVPYGPHSIRVRWHGEEPPIQVIDLPGGNKRIAAFTLGADGPPVRLLPLIAATTIATDRPTVVSVLLRGATDGAAREMWLNARSPAGIWKRFEMTMLKSADGLVGVAVFPPTMADAAGNALWYVSALTQQGDEYFTEIHGRMRKTSTP